MRDLTKDFGENAGKIWRALDEEGPLTLKQLLKLTDLKKDKLYAGIGWLARENKIIKEENIYRIGSPNRIPETGAIAGKIWKVLDIWGEVDRSSIKKLGRLDEHEIYTGLGWLAREGKIRKVDDESYGLE